MEGLVMLFDFYRGKTVLITGNTGFKGSWLSEILLLCGANVVGYSLEPSTNPNLFELAGLRERMTTIYGDVRDLNKLVETIDHFQPDIVFHLAAQPIVLTGYKEPSYTYEVNVLGTVNVLEAIRRIGCVKSFLNVTTDKVYENNDQANYAFRESDKLDGFDPYSNSKSCSELVTHCYKKSFFSESQTMISTARAGNVIGGGDFSPNRIIPDCVRAMEAHKIIEVRNSHSIRPYQFVLEPLFVYLLIAEKQYFDHNFSGYYNVGPDSCDAITTGELVNLFCKKWGGQAKWEDHSVANAPHEAGYLQLDNSLLKETFGWKPVFHIEQAIEKVVEWEKSRISAGCNHDLSIILGTMDKQIISFSEGFQL